jgi:hypothetical protein
MRGSPKALKETRRTPDHANAVDAPFSTPSVPERMVPPSVPERMVPPSPALRNFSEREKFILADRRRPHPLSSPNNDSPISHPEGNSALLIPTSSHVKSRRRRPSSFLGTSRPSVIVYKVATGPNFSGSRDVIRVSYGEAHRKRTPLTNSSNRSKERTLGRQGYSAKEYGITKRGDTTGHLNEKSMRSMFCSSRRYHDDKCSPSGLRRANIKMSGMLPPAEACGCGSFPCARGWSHQRTYDTAYCRQWWDRSRGYFNGLLDVDTGLYGIPLRILVSFVFAWHPLSSNHYNLSRLHLRRTGMLAAA